MEKEIIEVSNKRAAWTAIGLILKAHACDNTFREDAIASKGAGYPIFRHTEDASTWVSDLNTRFELNLSSGVNYNIWVNYHNDSKDRRAVTACGELVKTMEMEIKFIESLIDKAHDNSYADALATIDYRALSIIKDTMDTCRLQLLDALGLPF